MAVSPTYTTLLPSTAMYHIDNDGKEVMATGAIGASDTYVTGGWSLSPSTFGLQQILFVDCSPAGTGHPLYWNKSTGTIQAFSAAGTELANASTALQSQTFNIRIYGK